ncbi:MAG: hypothetical protein A4E42_01018 [Methanoregulaceae archaeon PtaU1.Bin222]|nr:MAG: hypothetical protein A4E42_01018 [Methanoregulaceae archaeon PtaU1.Bin222]
MGCISNLFAAEVDMGPSCSDKTLAGTCKQVTKLIELARVIGKDYMMDPVLVFDLSLRDNHDTGIIFIERLPAFQPVRLEGISRAENQDPLRYAAPDELIRLHETRDRD